MSAINQAPVQSAYSCALISEVMGKRVMRVETDWGMLEVHTELGELPAVSITNFMLGSSNLILDDVGVSHLVYELTRYLDQQRARKSTQ